MLNSIEAERARNRLTKAGMAEKLGVSVKTYYNWISQKSDMPISALIKLAGMFDTTTDYLLMGADGMERPKES